MFHAPCHLYTILYTHCASPYQARAPTLHRITLTRAGILHVHLWSPLQYLFHHSHTHAYCLARARTPPAHAYCLAQYFERRPTTHTAEQASLTRKKGVLDFWILVLWTSARTQPPLPIIACAHHNRATTTILTHTLDHLPPSQLHIFIITYHTGPPPTSYDYQNGNNNQNSFGNNQNNQNNYGPRE
jgi:hypothetical protein